jgi:photosystem II stability/assembly factor-like uncharacterized protein
MEELEAGLYAASRQGVLVLECGPGETGIYTFALNGVPCTRLAADAKGVLLAVGTSADGLRVTPDGGRTWHAPGDLAEGEVRALAARDRLLFAVRAPGEVLRSDDGGRRFLPVATLPLAGSEARVSASLLRPDGLLVAAAGAGLFLLPESGGSLRDVTGELPRSPLCLAAGAEGALLVGTAKGLYVSERPATGPWLPRPVSGERRVVTAVACHPAGSDVAVLGAARRFDIARPAIPEGADAWLLRSEDGGSTWVEAECRAMPVVRGAFTAVVFAPREPDRVFAGTTSGEVFESRDGGVTFDLAAATLPGVLDLVAGPALAG